MIWDHRRSRQLQGLGQGLQQLVVDNGYIQQVLIELNCIHKEETHVQQPLTVFPMSK
jgi:hypothetical protein